VVENRGWTVDIAAAGVPGRDNPVSLISAKRKEDLR